MKSIWLVLLFGLVFRQVVAQVTFPVNGIPVSFHGSYAYVNCTLHTRYDNVIQNATLIVRNGKIEAVGKDIKIPKDAVVTDVKGQHVYPAFVDLYSDYGIKKSQPVQGSGAPQFLSNKGSIYNWNQAVKPEVNAYESYATDTVRANAMRAMGFGYALTENMDGVMRGTAAFVNTGNGRESQNLISHQAATAYSFDKGTSTQDYPSSLMGSFALLRQTFYDAHWYENVGQNEEQNLSLDAFNRTKALPKIFQVTGVQTALRADAIADEFNQTFIIKGNGDEYQLANEIKNTNATFIIPLTFPLPYDVKDVNDAAYVPLSVMKHWELAPFNARILNENNIPFCITSFGIANANDFLNNLRRAVNNGLPKEAALKALTVTPASLLKMENTIGTLEEGKRAAFFITNGDLFGDTTSIINVFINDRYYSVTQKIAPSLKPGVYKLTVNKLGPFDLVVDDNPRERKPYIQWNDTMRIPVVMNYNQPFVSMEFALPSQQEEYYNLSGYESDTTISGESYLPTGTKARWSAVYAKPYTRSDTTFKGKDSIPKIPSILYPFQAYGSEALPKQEDVIFKNATVWTNEKDGILQNTDVWIHEGKIYRVGKNISGNGVKTIDATNKHLTAGVIDEHSHIAIMQGVNEGTQSVTSEVRIGDVLNSRDVNIYRQLAGGVTTSHLLHGSANAIGGQTQLIKLRWGYAPDKLKFENADGFIKFALGENVKQANWGDLQTVRFPQSRMGVEQVFYDAFTRAKNYESSWKDYNKNKSKLSEPRRDLELDALVEIMNEKRFITCHSYVQSEINMLMHVGDSMGFKVNTFTHILEGYKVADKMKKHGANASTFSDWWAYKYEVYDAIPYNGAILYKMGLNTSFNSDDAEMARRLNQEAAKAVKYGGVSEEDAWKFVTLNPAKMLHVDDRVGSIKVGKDADVVLWSTNPLSIYAKAERTYVDGICFYNIDDDLKKRNYIRTEKSRLIALMQQAKKSGVTTQPFEPQPETLYHCDTLGDFVK